MLALYKQFPQVLMIKESALSLNLTRSSTPISVMYMETLSAKQGSISKPPHSMRKAIVGPGTQISMIQLTPNVNPIPIPAKISANSILNVWFWMWTISQSIIQTIIA